jgi:predicted PolB exonuclease-like 3'-5' exonuclease
MLSDFGACSRTSLAGAAKLIGLPGKDGVDGSQVEGLFHSGQIDALRNYCLSDVAQTAFVFLRYKLLSGAIDKDRYVEAARALLSHMETDPRMTRLVEHIDTSRLLLADTDPPPA